MHPKTAKLREAVRKAFTLKKKVQLLHNAYAGETCYILTCGPSIGESLTPEARAFLADKLVMSVKQTYDLAPEICDFHILNSWNYAPYTYGNSRPIVVSERAKNDPKTPGLKADLAFRVPNPSDFENRLATSGHFDKWLLTETFDRPWGPGVMYELCFYLLVHMGVTEIVTLGWDLGELNVPTMEHFFEESPDNASEDAIANRPRIRPFEVADIAASTKTLYYWLKAKGINLYVVSNRSLVDEIVPRLATPDAPRNHVRYQAELLSNGPLKRWHGSTPTYWSVSPAEAASPSIDEHGVVCAALKGLAGAPATLEQSIRMEPFFAGGHLRAVVEATCDTPESCALILRVVPKATSSDIPLVAQAEHPGDGAWRWLECEISVPESYAPHTVELELRSQSQSTTVRHASLFLKRV